MSKNRNYIEEILSIQSRNRYHSYFSSITSRLENLELLFNEDINSNKEILKYFPIGLVACLEGYYRIVIKQLIDSGDQFLNNVSDLKKNHIDFDIVKAVHQKTISLGDFIAHILQINNLDDINSHLSILIKKDFLNELKNVYDRYEVEVLNRQKLAIIENPAEVNEGIKKTFELRHIFAHEIVGDYEINPTVISLCFKSTKLLIKATSELISELLNPNAPLTQSAMNQYSKDEYNKVIQEINLLENEIASSIESEELILFKESQDLWKKSMNSDSEIKANIVGKGGSIWESMYYSEAKRSVKRRIEYLTELRKLIFTLFKA